jgi:hypothetical protein
LATIDLGDARRDRRAIRLVERLAEYPTASIPGGCGGWAETQGAYRLFANEAYDWLGILEPHRARMAGHLMVQCLQDTTERDFNGQAIKGLGPLCYPAPAPASTVSGPFCRAARGCAGRAPASPPDDPDPARDVPAPDLCRDTGPGAVGGAGRLDVGAGAEGRRRHASGGARESALDGRVWAGGGPGPDHQIQKVGFAIRHIHQTRTGQSGGQSPLGARPIEWRLPANRLAGTREAVVELIEWCRARWGIGQFFLILKEGCRVEALQLGTVGRLERAFALFLVVARRIAWLMRLGRTVPGRDASGLFELEEWQAAYLLARQPVPRQPPPLREMLRLIARQGGFLGRKCDGEPGGAKTLWLGLQRVRDAAAAIKFARERGNL